MNLNLSYYSGNVIEKFTVQAAFLYDSEQYFFPLFLFFPFLLFNKILYLTVTELNLGDIRRNSVVLQRFTFATFARNFAWLLIIIVSLTVHVYRPTIEGLVAHLARSTHTYTYKDTFRLKKTPFLLSRFLQIQRLRRLSISHTR